ncbi:hypothetical protein ACHAXS_009573 [Conticribra weissflogii]
MPSKLLIPVFLYREKFGERNGEEPREHLRNEQGPNSLLRDDVDVDDDDNGGGDDREWQLEEGELADRSADEPQARQSPKKDDEISGEMKQQKDEASRRPSSYSPGKNGPDTQQGMHPLSSESPERVQVLTAESLLGQESSELEFDQRDGDYSRISSVEIERHWEVLRESNTGEDVHDVEAVEIGEKHGMQCDSTNLESGTGTPSIFPSSRNQNKEQSLGGENHVVPNHLSVCHKQISSTINSPCVQQGSQQQIDLDTHKHSHDQDHEPLGDRVDDILGDYDARHNQTFPPRENSCHCDQRSERQNCEKQSNQRQNDGQTSMPQKAAQSVMQSIAQPSAEGEISQEQNSERQRNEQQSRKQQKEPSFQHAEVCPTDANSVGQRGQSMPIQQSPEGSKSHESCEVSNSEGQSPARKEQVGLELAYDEHRHLQHRQEGEKGQHETHFSNIPQDPYVDGLMSPVPIQADTTRNHDHAYSQPHQSDPRPHQYPNPNPNQSEHQHVHHQQHHYSQHDYGQPYNHNPPPHDQIIHHSQNHYRGNQGSQSHFDQELHPPPQPHHHYPQHHHENRDHPPPQTRPPPPSHLAHPNPHHHPLYNHQHHQPTYPPAFSQPQQTHQQTQQQPHNKTHTFDAHPYSHHQPQYSHQPVNNHNPLINKRDYQTLPPHQNKPPDNQGATLVDLTAENDHPTGIDKSLQNHHPTQPVQSQWSKLEDSIIVNTITTFLQQHARTSTTTQASASTPVFTDWGGLAKKLPNRTECQICHRWINHLNPAINTAPFTHDEDVLLYKRYSALFLQQPRREFRNSHEKYLWQMDLFNLVSVNYFGNKRSGLQLRRRWYDVEFREKIKKLYCRDGSVLGVAARGNDAAGMASSEPESSRNDGGPVNDAGEGVSGVDERTLNIAGKIANSIAEASHPVGGSSVNGGYKKRPRSNNDSAIASDENTATIGNKKSRGIFVTDSTGQLVDWERTMTNTNQLDTSRRAVESRDQLNDERRRASNLRTGVNSCSNSHDITAGGPLEKMLAKVNSHTHRKLKKNRKKLGLSGCSEEENSFCSKRASENARTGMIVERWSEYQIDSTKSLPKLEGIRHRLITLLQRVEGRINEELVAKALREKEFGIFETLIDCNSSDEMRESKDGSVGEKDRIDCCPLCLSTEDKDQTKSSEGLESTCEICDARNFCRHCRSKCQICSRDCCVDCLMGCSGCGSGAFCCDCAGYGLTARSENYDDQEDAMSGVIPGGGFCEKCIVKELRSSAHGQNLGKKGCQKSVKKVQSVIRKNARDKGGNQVQKLRKKKIAKKNQTFSPEVCNGSDGRGDTANDTAGNSPAAIAARSVNDALPNNDSISAESVNNDTANQTLFAYSPPAVSRPVPLPPVDPLCNDKNQQCGGPLAECNRETTRIEADMKMTRHKFIIDCKGPLGITIDEGKQDKRITVVTDVQRCSAASGYGLRIGDIIVPPQTPRGVRPTHQSTRIWFKSLLQRRPCEFFVLRKFGGDDGISKFLATIFPQKELPFSLTYSIHRFVLRHFRETFGIEVREVSTKQFNFSYVTKVDPNSTAERLGIMKRDIICRPTKGGRLLSNVNHWFKNKLSSRERPFLFEIVRLHKVATNHYAALPALSQQNKNCSSDRTEKVTHEREFRELIDLSDESQHYREQSAKITTTLHYDGYSASRSNTGRQKGLEAHVSLQPHATNTPTPLNKPQQNPNDANSEEYAVNTTPIQRNDDKTNKISGATSSSSKRPSLTGAPTPVLVGTLSYDDKDGIRCHKICGTWRFEGLPESESQKFELTRMIPSNDDMNELPKNGIFNGSFVYQYQVDVKTSKKKLKMTTVVKEENVNITFTKTGTDNTSFLVEGKGNNQFGTFEIFGTAEKSLQDDDPALAIRMHKKYIKANKEDQLQPRISMGHNASDTSKTSQNELPPPSTHFSSGVICLRGKLSWESSGMRKIQLIQGVWSTGLDNILMDPENVNGICHEFEYQQRSGFEYEGSTPLSGRHTGWFRMKSDNDELTDIHENFIFLNFEKNSDGFYNVNGKGGNEFGQYIISGTLSADNEITLFRHYCQDDTDSGDP